MIFSCEKEKVGPTPDDPVNIPDTAFFNALINRGVDTDGDGLISFSEAGTVTVLLVGYSEIVDMTGIEAFINLEYLWCGFNNIKDLDLSHNPKLRYLSCHDRMGSCSCWPPSIGGELIHLDISNNPLLDTLDVSYNPLTTLNLCNNAGIRYLNIEGNPLDTIYVWEEPFPPAGVEVEGLDGIVFIACGN